MLQTTNQLHHLFVLRCSADCTADTAEAGNSVLHWLRPFPACLTHSYATRSHQPACFLHA